MSFVKDYNFSIDTDYSYDNTKITLSNGKAELLDLGSGTYNTSNPTIKNTTVLNVQGISSFSATIIATGSDSVKFVIEVDGVNKYWTGSAWSTSSGYAQSNTIAEINTNIATISYGTGVAIRFIAYLHSDAGTSTPSVDDISITYNFWGGEATAPNICIVYGFVYDIEGNPINSCVIKANLEMPSYYNSQLQLSQKKAETTTNTDGYWELELIETESMSPEIKYKFEFKGFDYEDICYKSIPNEISMPFLDLLP